MMENRKPEAEAGVFVKATDECEDWDRSPTLKYVRQCHKEIDRLKTELKIQDEANDILQRCRDENIHEVQRLKMKLHEATALNLKPKTVKRFKRWW